MVTAYRPDPSRWTTLGGEDDEHRRKTKLVHEGAYAAEVEIELLEEDHEWAPFIPADAKRKLDKVRLALRRATLRRPAGSRGCMS